MRQIILASTSPRRRELLEKLGLPFIVVASDYVEDMAVALSPHKLAQFLALGKATAVAKNYSDGIVIAADTFVLLAGKVLGKPYTAGEAHVMLKRISGSTLSIITGFAVIDSRSKTVIKNAVATKIYMRQFSASEIQNYIKTGEPLDKAGAFAIQGIGAILVKKIEGDFFNAVGLPLVSIATALKKLGVSVL